MTHSIEESIALYMEVRDLWKQSTAYQHLVSALAQHNTKDWPIDKAVLLGLGPITGSIPKCQSTPEFWKRHVLIVML